MSGRAINRDDGFTLVELLVVILVIGILAAIAIPTLLTQCSKAHDVSAKADARSAQLAIEQWKQDHDTYNATWADLQTEDQDLAGNPRLTITGDATTYTVKVRSSSQNASDFSVSRDAAGHLSHDCTPAGLGGCPAGGHW
jgi:type IV pilus assembly protein PilA